MTTLRTFAIVVFFACSIGSLTALAQLFSPGELASAHRTLEGDDKCLQCHSSGHRIETPLCTKCHTDIGAQLSQGRGLHGREYKQQACANCHVEHRGRGHDLVRWPGGSRERFDHQTTGFPLRGGHQGVPCAQCHEQRNARGAPTFLGARAACNSCHTDPHEKRFGTDCQGCHNDRGWNDLDLRRFEHDRLARFPLHGKHEQVKCAECHGTPAKYRGIAFETCTSCHEDPHRGSLGKTCTNCHSENGWQALHMRRSAHPVLSILGGHSQVACKSCHDRGLTSAPSKGSRCVKCHAPVHEAKLGNDCGECHKGIQWLGLPDALGRSVHASTPFPLRGRHATVACTDCHSPKLPRQERFRQLAFGRCLDCHEDPHSGEFAARDGGECAGCHDEHGFSPSHFGHQAHATTAFPLEGSHQAVTCSGCHRNEHPRLDWHLEDAQCASCHENPHGTQFALEMQDGGCAHCHNPRSWREPNIDHRTWPLTGAHGMVACGACHEPSAQDRKSGRGASYRGVPRECGGCHEDAHLGQFRLTEPTRQCRDCHDTTAFEIARFDHRAMTGYALEGDHARVPCQNCHPSAELRNGEKTIRWRLTYKRCADCHADPHTESAR